VRLPWKRARPRLSIVVVVYRMPRQAERTLHSLSARYQRDVVEGDYEIIVVENDSPELLGEERTLRHGANIRYYHRHETRRSPVFAINFGAAQARGTHLAVMIDGARLLTPGVVRLSLDAFNIEPHAAVAVPGYHIGRKLQQLAVDEGYDEAADAALIDSIGWPADGYRLHEIAVLSSSCAEGFLRPLGESNFLATSRARWEAIGGMDERYDDHGGGFANLDLYKRLLECPQTPFWLLWAEGSFHQFHGGVTTGAVRGEDQARLAQAILAQDTALRGAALEPPATVPVLFGRPHPAVYRFLRHSLERAAPP